MGIKTPLAIAIITVTATFGAAPATADANFFKSVWKVVSSPVEAVISAGEVVVNGADALVREAVGDKEGAKRSWKRADRHMQDLTRETVAPLEVVVEGAIDVGEFFFDDFGDFEPCDCSRPLEEQGHCEVPKPPCLPDSVLMKPAGDKLLPTDICGLLRYVRMDGNNSVYRGVRHGSAWIIESENGKVVGALRVHIVPDANSLWNLNPNQGWNCGNPW